MIQFLDPSEIPAAMDRGFAGAAQPARRALGIRTLGRDGAAAPVLTSDTAATAFCTLVSLRLADARTRPPVLVVAPLSGHFALGLRDLVIGLLPDFAVHVTDWTNVRHVGLQAGSFGYDDNVETVAGMLRRIGPGASVIGVCQGGVPALAAASLMAADADPSRPEALALAGAPIDALANPTRVVRLIRAHAPDWYRRTVIRRVPGQYAGRGRAVYPADLQAGALSGYFARRMMEGGEIRRKLLADDGADPVRYPFLHLYTSVMDLDAPLFVENLERVFLRPELALGTLICGGRPVEPAALASTPLLTLEGAEDDIAAPGQTAAALGLCGTRPAAARQATVVRGCGHFGLFHGRSFRETVLPELRRFFLRAAEGARVGGRGAATG